MKKWLSLFLWVVLFLAVGSLLGSLTQTQVDGWYRSIIRSPLTPPGVVFSVVWSILYLMIAVSGWLFWQQRSKQYGSITLLFYALQVLLNWSWTPVFFSWHLIGLAFILLLGIIFMTMLTILYGLRVSPLASYLLVPYWLWLLFAAYLNGYIGLMN